MIIMRINAISITMLKIIHVLMHVHSLRYRLLHTHIIYTYTYTTYKHTQA